MKRRLVTPFVAIADSPALGGQALLAALGAVELDPAQVPDHWLEPLPPGRTYSIHLEGAGATRPMYSDREAGVLARTAREIRGWQQLHLDRAAELGVPRPIHMPRFLAVSACPRCHELALTSSAGGKADWCQYCPFECANRPHPRNRANCPDCKVRLERIWTTEQDIPGAWS